MNNHFSHFVVEFFCSQAPDYFGTDPVTVGSVGEVVVMVLSAKREPKRPWLIYPDWITINAYLRDRVKFIVPKGRSSFTIDYRGSQISKPIEVPGCHTFLEDHIVVHHREPGDILILDDGDAPGKFYAVFGFSLDELGDKLGVRETVRQHLEGAVEELTSPCQEGRAKTML